MKIFTTILIALILSPRASQAQWTGNPVVPVNVVTRDSQQAKPKMIPDGSGGAIIVWEDSRWGRKDLFAQRIDSNGNLLWAQTGGYPTAWGVEICPVQQGDQINSVIVSDGSGGAFIVWEDSRGSDKDIYGQRINSSGVRQWADVGYIVSGFQLGDQVNPKIISDDSGGAIIAWETSGDIYAKRIFANGGDRWNSFNAYGLPICTALNNQDQVAMVGDGGHGAIFTWRDNRSTEKDIFAQRYNSNGIRQWVVGSDTNGIVVCDASDSQEQPAIVADGSGGAIVTWEDMRGGSDYDIYAQRLNSAGIRQWAAGSDSNGFVICSASSQQTRPLITADGAGGGLITWTDFRGGNNDIYSQRVNSAGSVLWTTDGVAVCTATGNQNTPVMSSVAGGGAIIAWEDATSGANFAQRINSTGNLLWAANGVAVVNPFSGPPPFSNPAIVIDNNGFTILAADRSNSSAYDIYAQRIKPNGTLDDKTVPQIPQNVAADSMVAGQVTLHWNKISDSDMARYRIFMGTSPNPTVQIDSTAFNQVNDTLRVISGLTVGTRYYFRVNAVDSNSLVSNFSNEVSALVIAGEPTAQPTNLRFSLSPLYPFTALTVSFTAAAGNPTGYIALSDPGLVLFDGSNYNVGFNGVLYIGSDTTFYLTGLSPGQHIFISIYAYNNSGSAIDYNTTNPDTGTVHTRADLFAPVVSQISVNPNPVNLGNAVTVQCIVTDSVSVDTVILAYKKGSDVGFTNSVGMLHDGALYNASVSSTSVTASGVIYRIIARDQSGNRDTTFGTIQVTIPAGAVTIQNTSGSPYTSGFPDKIWRMISVPLDLDDKSVATVLDGFGPPGNKTWKLFDKDQDISNSTTVQFAVGRSFWLKQLNVPNGVGGKQISLAGGKTVSSSVALNLVPGFNMIANPFTFPIDWNANTNAGQNSFIKGPIRYDGNKYIGPGQGDATLFNTLNPWDGYWVYNASSSSQILTVEPIGALGKRMAKPALAGWYINFSAKAGEFEDNYNYVGAASDALDAEDRYDLPELPVIGDYVSVSFDHTTASGKTTPYTIDYRSEADGHAWLMSVRTNINHQKTYLQWSAQNLPADYQIRILDVSNNKIVDGSEYTFDNPHESLPVAFKVFAGTKDFVETGIAKAQSELPTTFKLSQNYPNPFNPSTKIRYELPTTETVSLVIYNALGQVVKTLVSHRAQGIGVYEIDWNGTNQIGQSVASGIYIYRLQAGRVVKTKKMLLIK
ncbi:T9SS type A sorting domain-containing protein [bacterium]|nr:MAG: T9SS type A sorting domain-containing protein [bacterium]